MRQCYLLLHKMAVPAATSSVVSLLSDPATLVSLGVVAAGAAYYLATRPAPIHFPVPLDNQSLELPVRCTRFEMFSGGLCRREESVPLDY